MLNEFNFLFNNENINISFDANGIAWFKGPEIAKILGYSTFNMYKMIPDSEKDIHIVNTLGGPQKVMFINEMGIYRIAMVSRRPEAIELQNKVFYDILPCIRKYGAYIDTNTRIQLDANPELIHTLNANIDNHEKKRMYHLIYPDSTEYRNIQKIKRLENELSASNEENNNMMGMINYLEGTIDRINSYEELDLDNYHDNIDYGNI